MANNLSTSLATARPRYVAPLDKTDAENYYYSKQINEKTPMVVHFCDGEKIEGVLEWYDRKCLKLHCPDGRHVLIYKHVIKYMHKMADGC